MIKDIKEEIFTITNSQGHAIHCVYNYIDADSPLIVIPPQFEGTVRLNMLPMIYFVNNGFRVLRFDFTNHQGNSFGNFADFTLSQALADCQAVLEFVHASQQLNASAGVGLLGISISSRILLRYMALQQQPIDCYVSMLGVVDAGSTIYAVTGQDIQLLLRDPQHRYGVVKAIKHMIDADPFMHDLQAQDWHSLSGTQRDIDQLVAPTYLIVAENDKWVNIADYHTAYRNNQAILRQTYKIPNGGHELYKNPEAAKLAAAMATRCFASFFLPNAQSTEIVEPTITELMEWNTRERARERQHDAQLAVG